MRKISCVPVSALRLGCCYGHGRGWIDRHPPSGRFVRLRER
jgi:hypothetical protein